MEPATTINSRRKKYIIAIAVLIVIIAIDQLLKFRVKTSMLIGDEIHIFGNWFKLHFTENCGMAFGLRPGGDDGKIVLTVFRMFAALGITWYLVHIIRKGAAMMAVICFTLILAGAMGNIVDSILYGWLFTPSTAYDLAFIDPGNGYAPLFKGCVVDMLYFPLIQGHFPDWFLGGRYFEFFRPIFNIADTSISVGVFTLILFQRSIFVKQKEDSTTEESENTVPDDSVESPEAENDQSPDSEETDSNIDRDELND